MLAKNLKIPSKFSSFDRSLELPLKYDFFYFDLDPEWELQELQRFPTHKLQDLIAHVLKGSFVSAAWLIFLVGD